MKNIKRLLGLILAMVLLIGCLPLSVYAQETASGTCGDNLTWTLVDGVLTISGTGAMDDFALNTIPWVDYCNSIQVVKILDGVTTIGAQAFWEFSEITSIILPDSLTTIGDWAFNNCSSLSAITLPQNLTIIGAYAFAGCSEIDTISIPDSVTELGAHAFNGCTALTAVELSKNISALGEFTFANCESLTSISIPEGLDTIGSYTFSLSGLTTLIIPENVSFIGERAFIDCSDLSEIWFKGNVPDIAENAFESLFADVIVTAYYPANNSTWTEEVMQDYGGDITWVPYGNTTEEPAITGYNAGLSTTTPTATTGEKVYVSVAVDHAEETTFNAGELVFTYSPAQLSFNQANSTLGNATVKAENGTLTLEDYGAAKNCGNGIYTLVFDAIANGTATVKLTAAAFSNQENAAASDLIAGVAYPDSVSIAVSKKSFAVTLPDGMTGAATVTDGNSYTFRISDKNYTYSNITATVDGQTVSVTDNGDGSYTINSVSGVLKITATRIPKSYKVSFTGSAAADITGAATTATYGTDYKFTIPAVDGWVYKLESVTVDGTAYSGYTSSETTLTIPGTAITGEIVITVSKEETRFDITVNGASGDVSYDGNVQKGEDVTITLIPEAGYSYTVTATIDGKEVDVIITGNIYTVENVTGDVVFNVKKIVNTDGVSVDNYLTVNGSNIWLVGNFTTVAENKVPSYDGNPMFWSEAYQVYCYLVIADALDADTARKSIGIVDGSAVAVDYGMDVNMTGTVDANDAQLTYNIYNAYYDAFDEAATIEKFLRADVNKDCKVNTTDSAAIINKILNG